MARAVRKVSRVSTKNQKKEGLNKKLIAIIADYCYKIMNKTRFFYYKYKFYI